MVRAFLFTLLKIAVVNCQGEQVHGLAWLPYGINLIIVVFVHSSGYRPFVEACINADEKGEALKYIPKLADPRERAEVIQFLKRKERALLTSSK